MLASLIVLTGGAAAWAEPAPNPDEMAVYLEDKFLGNSAIVEGDIYSADGDVEFNNAEDNKVTGNIYYNKNRNFVLPNFYTPSFAGRAVPLDVTHFDGVFPDLIDFPAISNYIGTHDPQWGTPVLTITQNSHFGTLNINGTSSVSPVVVDTSHGDVYIVADNISWGYNKSIKVSGSGRLFLFINNFSPSAPVQIDNGDNPDSTYVFSKASLSHVNMNLYAHVYYNGISNLDLKGKITGSVLTAAATIKIEYGGNVVNGLVYAPNANATIQSPGTGVPNIIGRLVAKSLALKQGGRIVYSPAYAGLSANTPPQVLKYEVAVTANNPAWGTASPSYKKVNYGESVQISATANPGYKFTGFTGSPQPDGSGYITVTGPVSLTANFEPDAPTPGEYVNGLLGEYYDAKEPVSDSALKIKRIDDRIAFNFGLDSPDPEIEPENFSIRWTGYISPAITDSYTFMVYSDDGVRLRVNDQLIINRWGPVSLDFTAANPVYLEAGQYYPIELEYQQLPLYAGVFLFWESGSVPMGLVPDTAFFVTQSDYNGYTPAKYFNSLDKTGTGFTNKFYTPQGYTEGTPAHTEINSINYLWGMDAPDGIYTDEFYGKMEGYLQARFTEETTLLFTVDDAVKVWVADEDGNWLNGGNPVIDEWEWHSMETFSYKFNTVAGQRYRIKIEYADFGISAACVMGWEGETKGKPGVVPREFMYPV